MEERRTAKTKTKSKQSLIVKNGEIGVMNADGCFRSHTNFCMEVLHAVQSPQYAAPLFGFVFLVKSTGGITK